MDVSPVRLTFKTTFDFMERCNHILRETTFDFEDRFNHIRRERTFDLVEQCNYIQSETTFDFVNRLNHIRRETTSVLGNITMSQTLIKPVVIVSFKSIKSYLNFMTSY